MTRTSSTSTAPACPPPASTSSSSGHGMEVSRRQRRRLARVGFGVGALALLAGPFLLGCCHAFLVPAPFAVTAGSTAARRAGWRGQQGRMTTMAAGPGAAAGSSDMGSGSGVGPLYAAGRGGGGAGAAASSTGAAETARGGRGRRRAAAAEEEDDDGLLLSPQDEQGGDADALILSEDGSGVEEGGAPVMLGTQSAAAAAALKEAAADPGVAGTAGAVAADPTEEEIASAPLPAAPTKRRGGRGNKRASAYPEQDYSVKTVDDVCRATINVISSGDEQDLQMLTPFVERLLTRYGDHVEILHRSYVPDDKPGLRLLEIWFEGFETFRLYSRYQFTKRGKQGDLTPEVIDEMCSKIDYAMYLDATGDFGPL